MNNFEKYLHEYNLYLNEGERAVVNLNEIAKYIGYEEDGFLYGSATPFERFLQDNSGCVEVIKEWIADNFSDEFKDFEDSEDE